MTSSTTSPSSTASTPRPNKVGVPSTPSPNITPLHDPTHRAVVVQQTAPLGHTNPNPVVPGQTVDPSVHGGTAGLGQKALLAKKFAKANKPSLISPTDALQSPCTAKLAGAKQKHFAKIKPTSLNQKLTSLRYSNNENARPTEL